MPRVKRNRENPILDTDGYIKKYFGPDISTILVPSVKSIQNCPIPYVNHLEAEKVLGDFMEGDSQKDKSIVFTGLKGSGKTTILRHVFGIEENSNKCKIIGRTIVIPIDFNRSQISAETAVLSSLRSAVTYICNVYSIEEPALDNEKFFEFVGEQRDDLLRISPEHDSRTPHCVLLKTFLDKAPVPYSSCQLQYVLASDNCDINLVVLIVDNVEGYAGEGISRSKYLKPVIEALRLYDCISQRQQPTKWCFNLVIACRHYIWRLIKGEEDENGAETPLIESFITSELPYDLRNPVEINSIVAAREQVFSKNRNSKRWETSVNVVKEILKKMEGTLGDFILQLVLKDIRKSFEEMQLLILHNGLQSKTDEEIQNSPGAFQINSSQFDLTRINLIRTLAIGQHAFYTGTGLIPNLLYNKKEEYLELYPLLTLKYFLKKCDYEEPSWDNYVSISQFYQSMKDLFSFNDIQIQRLFMDPVVYFLKNRILLRSADQQQDEVPGLTNKEELLKIEKVYVSGAAVRLWEELSMSSALFQLFMDDIFFDNDSDYLTIQGNDIEHCFKYLQYLRDKEEQIFNRAYNQSSTTNVEGYIQCFGNTSICEYLATGLLKSLDYIVDHDSSPRGLIAKKTLREVDSFISHLGKWSWRKG